jgi:serine/threonine protein kinase/WD40 repeat protein
MTGTGSIVDRDPLDVLAEEFVERLRRGEHPSISEYEKRLPERADEIRPLFETLALVEQFKPSKHDPSAPTAPAPSASAPRGLPERLGEYRILRIVGVGGMGIVYEAEHETLKHRVALKVMLPRYANDQEFRSKFLVEARAAARLHHTNIVPVFDFGQGDVCYYAMQFIDGVNLHAVLDDVRRIRRCDEKTRAAADGDITATEPVRVPTYAVSLSLMTGCYTPGATPSGPSTATYRGGPVQTGEDALEFDLASGLTEAAGGTPMPNGASQAVGATSDPAHASFVGGPKKVYFREVARLMAQAASALEYAHNKGVLHRDIKPLNLLLDAAGNLWITDFGLAKLADAIELAKEPEADDQEDTPIGRFLGMRTAASRVAGTLRYMGPERFNGKSDARSDVFALGATLYEMLTLVPAFPAEHKVDLMRQIVSEPPPPPRAIDRRIPRDLEAIALKALAKDPNDRFETPGAMRDELRLFLELRPVHSRPVPFYKRFWRWCQRSPGLAGANIAAAVLTTALAIVMTIAFIDKRNQAEALKVARFHSDEAALDARRKAIDAYTAQARAGRFGRRPGQRFESLEAVRQAMLLLEHLPKGPETVSQRETLRDLAAAALALPDLNLTSAKPIGRISAETAQLDIDPAFERYVLADHSGNCVVYRVADGAKLFPLPNKGPAAECRPRFGPDGRLLAVWFWDGRLQLWRIDGPAPVPVIAEQSPVPHFADVDFRPDGAAVVVAKSDGGLELIDAISGRKRVLPRREGRAYHVAFHPDGRRLAVVSERAGKHVAEIRELEDAQPIATVDLPAQIHHMACSPDGRRVAMSGHDSRLYVWDFKQRDSKLLVLTGATRGAGSVAFNHRGDLLVSYGWEGELRLWDPHTGRQLMNVPIGMSALPRFRADDRYLCVCSGQSLEAIEVASGRELGVLPVDPAQEVIAQGLSIAPDSRVLAARSQRGVQFWDLERGDLLVNAGQLGWSAVEFEADGSLLTFERQGVLRWPSRMDGRRLVLGPHRHLTDAGAYGGHLASSRDGRVVVATYFDSGAYAFLRDRPGQPIHLGPQRDVRGVAVSPDGRWAALASHYGPPPYVIVWDVETGRRVNTLDVAQSAEARFSPDCRWLATSASGSCKVWEVGTWRLAREFGTDTRDVGFSPDSTLLAVCCRDQVQLYDPATGRRVATLESSEQSETNPCFSPDGRMLAVCDEQTHSILVWDLGLIRSELAKLGLDWDAPTLPPAPAEGASPTPPMSIELDYACRDKAQQQSPAGRPKPALETPQQAVAAQRDDPYALNSLAWSLLTSPEPLRDVASALDYARRAVKRKPAEPIYLNTLGVALYRSGRDAEAVSVLEQSLAAGMGQLDAFDLFFLAMARHRLGDAAKARADFDRAVRWVNDQPNLFPQHRDELKQFRAEAEAVLAGRGGELPVDVFAGDRRAPAGRVKR